MRLRGARADLTLDQTGLAQKGGAVVSDVKIDDGAVDASNRIVDGGCDLYLGYDLLVAADLKNVSVLSSTATAIISTSVVPAGAMVSAKTVLFPDEADAMAPILDRASDGRVVSLDARHYAETLFGSEQLANMFLIGVAFQIGALPLSDRVVEEAIALNGVAVDANVQAFRRGRQLVADRDALDQLVDSLTTTSRPVPHIPSRVVKALPGSELERLVALRRHELVLFQDEKLAQRYESLVERARAAEHRAGLDGAGLGEAVARYAFKLMAYKDEYEAARLARSSLVVDDVAQQFGDGATVEWRLHPPTLRAFGMKKKISLGPWFSPVFGLLYRMSRLRGTALGKFGHAEVRKVERRLSAEYESTIDACIAALNAGNVAAAVKVAALPDLVRGYEDPKLRSVAVYNAERAKLVEEIGLTV